MRGRAHDFDGVRVLYQVYREHGGIIKHGAKLLYAFAEATVPKVTSDAGLLLYWELDDTVGLIEFAGDVLTDTRRGKNGRHGLAGQFRQSVFGLLGGYDDVNDADRSDAGTTPPPGSAGDPDRVDA